LCHGIPNQPCGRCRRCDEGLGHLCETVTIVALYDETATIDPMVLLHKEATIVPSAMVTPEDVADSLELLRSGRAVGEGLVTHREKLADRASACRRTITNRASPLPLK
jgi:threonine dehydrogenase-like Zn-dependent dehydrogenase